jgi:hypothetical protein
MSLSHSPNLTLARRRARSGVAEQVVHQCPQVHAPIEAVGECTKVLAGVLAELEGLMGAIDHGLEVAQDNVDPFELRDVTWKALPNHDVRVGAPRIDHSGKARQAVAAYIATGLQIGPSPLGYCLTGKGRDLIELDPQRVPILAGLHGRNERDLVGRAATPDAWALTAEIGIIELNEPSQRLLAVALRHGLHELLLDEPGCTVAGTQMPFEGQGRQACLVLADEVDGQKPGAQRQLGALHQRARSQRCLMPARSTLEELARAVTNHVVLRRCTARATKTVRPTQRHQRFRALRLCTVTVEELRHRHARLKLDLVHRHHVLPRVDGSQTTASVAHRMSLAELRDESGAVESNRFAATQQCVASACGRCQETTFCR